MVFFLGPAVLKEGLKTYFQKYKFKNTEAKDFLTEMALAAKKLDVTAVDILSWSKEWLESAGCSSFSLKVVEENGVLKSMHVEQTLYNAEKTPLNRLRTQRFEIALLDENM
jgi:aminopeptidase N